MPLVAALLGEEWQIYATAFPAVQMTILFSHGQSVMEGKPGINWKKIVTNPNMIAVVAGLVLFLTPLQLPDVLADTMTSMARAVGPVSMIMLGMALADIEWKKIFTGKRVYGMVLARMVLLPLVVGVTYEFNRFVGRHDNAFTRALSAPGMWLQNFTTFEPDDSMLEVAIEALTLVLPEEKGKDKW